MLGVLATGTQVLPSPQVRAACAQGLLDVVGDVSKEPSSVISQGLKPAG